MKLIQREINNISVKEINVLKNCGFLYNKYLNYDKRKKKRSG